MKGAIFKKYLLIFLYVLLLGVTVSFAWMLSNEINIVESVDIDYNKEGNNLVVAPKNLEVEIYMVNELGEDVLVTDKLNFDSIAPHSVVPFKIRFRNHMNKPVIVDVALSGITCSRESILDVVFVSAVASTGWADYSYTERPNPVYEKLSVSSATQEEDETIYSFKFLQNFSVPPTIGDNYLEMSCYFYFDGETMMIYHQDTILSIGQFRITQKLIIKIYR